MNAWRTLEREQHLAALAAIGLFVSMLLPWYSKTDTFVEHNAAKASQASLSAFQAFSFVEAAVLLVSAAVLAMLFARAEGRDFQLPGGDGTIVMIAGGWAALLIFYRLLDKPGLSGTEKITATVGVQWGIFIALLLALGLSYVGGRMRASERGHPPLRERRHPPRTGARPRERASERQPDEPPPHAPGEADSSTAATVIERDAQEARTLSTAPPRPRRAPTAPAAAQPSGERRAARSRSRFPPAPAEQMSFEDKPPSE
jgi:hypothetical protein